MRQYFASGIKPVIAICCVTGAIVVRILALWQVYWHDVLIIPKFVNYICSKICVEYILSFLLKTIAAPFFNIKITCEDVYW